MIYILKYICSILLLINFPRLIFTYKSLCYDDTNRPRKCSPAFENIAYEFKVTATNTCGYPPIEYCKQVDMYSETEFSHSKICDVCDNSNPLKSHSTIYLTDQNNPLKPTWWQSETMYEGIQSPNSVNLTFNFKKSFEITYIKINFFSPRPESFAIYKKTNQSTEWIPYQYYSSSCESTYGLPPRPIHIKHEKEAQAFCSEEFSDISPLTGASIAFSTLEGRPSAFNFDASDELKDWVTASDVKIVLNRLNTFGDEIFNKTVVLKSYYYAISDISIGGRCNCNGHSDICLMKQSENFDEKLKCDCKHNTDGTDCEKCLPFFNNIPWAPATFTNPHECKPCNCSGKSQKCFFDQKLYELTGHGGHCMECEDNTIGVHCELCRDGYYRNKTDNNCVECLCHSLGSISHNCNSEGKCQCKEGVNGNKCDQCIEGYYGLGHTGCIPCNCSSIGVIDNPPKCDSLSGKCRCKINVEGQKCDKCKPGYFNIDEKNLYGCMKCFCFGHSSECIESDEYYEKKIVSNFETNNEEWKAVDNMGFYIPIEYDNLLKSIFFSNRTDDIWLDAPKKYLGNQRNSFTKELSFHIKYNYRDTKFSKNDLIIENLNEKIILYSSFKKHITSLTTNSYGFSTFSIKLIPDLWYPILSENEFKKVLSNITVLRIKGSISGLDNIHFKNFVLNSAEKYNKSDENLVKANWIEKCKCPIGYTGSFCESCDDGYHREYINGDSYVRCIQCSCNNHSNICDKENGICECYDNTIGDNCERCKESYYGNPLNGKTNDCKKCQCPNDGPCAEIFNYQLNSLDIVCLNCPEGTQGNLCEICEDGYYMNTVTNNCEKCICNGNIDENAIGNCDPLDGKCLRCIFNTTGNQCEKCLHGYWGNPLNEEKCFSCDCFILGTNENSECDIFTGQCKCKPYVIGKNCNECEDNYWNIKSGTGCLPCNCDPIGSFNLTCQSETGQCFCKPGVTGKNCDECLINHYQLSDEGCKQCECNPKGSEIMQCDAFGKCLCKKDTIGIKCNKCKENYHDFENGCSKCDECYNLVMQRINSISDKCGYVRKLLNEPENFENLFKRFEIKRKLDNLTNLVSILQRKSFNSEIINYDIFLSEFINEILNISKIMKMNEIDYESKKDKIEALRYINSLIGNAGLELSSVQLIIEDLEAKLKISDSKTSQANNTIIQNLAIKSRYLSMKTEESVLNLKKKFDNELTKIKSSMVKINTKKQSLNTKNIKKIYNTYSPEEHITESNEIIGTLHENKDNMMRSYNKILDNKINYSIHESSVERILNENILINNMTENMNAKIGEITKQVTNLSYNMIDKKIKYTEAIWKEEKIKTKEYINLKYKTETSKKNVKKSFDALKLISKNLKNSLEFLENFEEFLNQKKIRSEYEYINKFETKQNIIKMNDFYKKITKQLSNLFEELRVIEIDNLFHNKKFDFIIKEFSKLSNKYENMNNIIEKSKLIAFQYENISTEIIVSTEFHLNYSDNMDTYQFNVLELTKKSQRLYDLINDDIMHLIKLNKSELKIEITKEVLIELEEKITHLDFKTKSFDELSYLEFQKKKINKEIEKLEKIIPALEIEINNLNKIKLKLNANDCYTIKFIGIDDTDY